MFVRQRTAVKPAPASKFLGSFAANARQKTGPAKGDSKSDLRRFFTDGWGDAEIWKAAFIEFVGTMSISYISAMILITISNFKTDIIAPYVGVSNIFLLSLFIYAISPTSGGHINPLITFITMTSGLTSFSRGLLYLIAQTVGGAVAGGLLRGSLGQARTEQYGGGGCFIIPGTVSQGQAFLIETIASFILVFLAFGLGIDPRQAQLFGPKLGPLLVGTALGLISFATVGLGEGYPGAQMNPARCFAFAVARNDFTYQWIWWAGSFAGGLLFTVVVYVAPPYHHETIE